MQWVRALFRTSRRLVGTDLNGNEYYEIIQGKYTITTNNYTIYIQYKLYNLLYLSLGVTIHLIV